MRILSLGAGVQSTTLLLMAEHAEIEPFDAAIFADTKWEPSWTYQHLDWLASVCRTPIRRVTAGSLRDGIRGGGSAAPVVCLPFHVRTPSGKHGIARRQCTTDYKLVPLRREARRLMDEAGVREAVMCIGVSLDEAHRVKDSGVRYLRNEYPLIDMRMTRWDCRLWLSRHGYEQPRRSACIGCPYRNDSEWREIRDDASAWSEAVRFDESLRDGSWASLRQEIASDAYLHRSLTPLVDVDLSSAEDHGQINLFGNECEGMCGN